MYSTTVLFRLIVHDFWEKIDRDADKFSFDKEKREVFFGCDA